MYSLNGISLHEGHAGWTILRAGTNTQGGIQKNITKVGSPGRPGYNPAPSTYTEQMIVFNVRTPWNRLDELLSLCYDARTLSRTDDATKEAYVELISAVPTSDEPRDGHFEVTITLSMYQGVWRDVDYVVEGPTDVTTPTQAFNLFSGLSAPVFDVDVFIKGAFDEFTLTDSGGSWLKTTREFTPGSSSVGLLWVGATQQAFVANDASPWVPTADASQYVDVSANGGFRLTPKMVGGDPAVRRVELSLTTLAQTSTTLRVRAKRAYRMN